ncbi:hypothetical protein V2J09_001976 [Rumex salicifolius]
MTTISSSELNFLVFRYLQESGFAHSAFVLGYEAGINKSPIDGNLVPPAALIKCVQKGLQLVEMEANLSNNETDTEDDFSFIQPMDLITKSVPELQQMVKEKQQRNSKKNKDKGSEREHGERRRGKDKGKNGKDRDLDKVKDREGRDKRLKVEVSPSARAGVDEEDNKKLEDRVHTEPEKVNASTAMKSVASEISGDDVTILEGHSNEVCACAWSPSGSLLASGSGDSTARIWTIADEFSRSHSRTSNVLVLKHVKIRGSEKSNDVTTLDWNGDGTLLATGSYDGQARVWSPDGELKSTLSKHKGPIFSLKWNKKGDYLLTGSCDKTAIVWDVKSDVWKQQFQFHQGPTLDVDWRNNISFATSSTDHMIHVCKIGENQPIKTFAGHQGEVNCVKWDPTGSLLASCSDDISAKIWSMKQDNFVHDLKEHSKEIYTIRWSPTGAGTSNPNQQLMLASASFDSTVKLWDVEHGKLLSSLNGHREPVYSIAFSPNGQYLASGSLDRSLHIWSLKDNRIVKTYSGSGGIFEVCWNKEGNKIAACFANNTTALGEHVDSDRFRSTKR